MFTIPAIRPNMGHKHRHLHPEFPIHITARTTNREAFPVPLPVAWEILTDYLFLIHHAFEIQILAFVLMPNHFHLICRDPKLQLPQAMEYFMRETTREMNRYAGRINQIWGGPYHSSLIDSYLYFLHAYKYLYRNPVAAGLCSKVEDYEFSSLHALLGCSHSILPIAHDPLLFERDLKTTLDWLNTSYSEVDRESLRRALKKSDFRLRPHPKNRRASELGSWSSVPFDEVHYKK